MEFGLEVNTDKTKHTLMPSEQNAGQNQNMKEANKSFENVAKFKYLGITVTYQNCMREEIKKDTKFRECLLQFGPEVFFSLPVCY